MFFLLSFRTFFGNIEVVERVTYEDYLADSTTQKYKVSGSASSLSFSSLCAYYI